jgi:hypothetical protein
MRTTAPNDNFTAAFRRGVGEYLKAAVPNAAIYYDRATGAAYPRAVFFYTLWTTDGGEMRGTLTVRVSTNTRPADADDIAQALLSNVDGAIVNNDDLFFYAHSGRVSPVEDTDKTITRRLFTADFIAMQKEAKT